MRMTTLDDRLEALAAKHHTTQIRLEDTYYDLKSKKEQDDLAYSQYQQLVQRNRNLLSELSNGNSIVRHSLRTEEMLSEDFHMVTNTYVEREEENESAIRAAQRAIEKDQEEYSNQFRRMMAEDDGRTR